jgi:hypothetical protein
LCRCCELKANLIHTTHFTKLPALSGLGGYLFTRVLAGLTELNVIVTVGREIGPAELRPQAPNVHIIPLGPAVESLLLGEEEIVTPSITSSASRCRHRRRPTSQGPPTAGNRQPPPSVSAARA